MSLLQWPYFIQIARLRRSVLIDQDEGHILVRSERPPGQEGGPLISQGGRIHAGDIGYFAIVIGLILRQSLVGIEKLEFALFASVYARHLQSQSSLVYFTRLTHLLGLLRPNCMGGKPVKSPCWMGHLRYSRKVNNGPTQQGLVFPKRKSTIIPSTVVTRAACAALDACSKAVYLPFGDQRVLNLAALKGTPEGEGPNY